jgi:predicted GNAT superfamily acetyltransferase
MAIPGALDEVVREDTPLAVRWREATRDAFLDYLARGYRVTELVPRGAVSFYVLSRWDR